VRGSIDADEEKAMKHLEKIIRDIYALRVSFHRARIEIE
jgi:copper homeostasis protein CutC